jgi:hypothetical protein
MVYFDNGGQFRNSVMHQSCSKLDVKLLFTKTYHPESKGKIERFNGTIEHFLSEVELDSLNITDLESLNKRFQAWVDIRYSNKEHSGIKKTPQEAYNDPSQPPQRFISEDEVYKAFLRTDSRKVDKSGCFSFDNRLFEMENGMTMVGRRVHFFFDPSDREKLWVDIPGHDITLAKPLNIKERAAPRPKLPPNIGKVDTTTSRVLEAAQKLHDAKNDSLKQAINFRELENKTND